MTILDEQIRTVTGDETTLGAMLDGRAALVVNVASKCGLTPQYAALQTLQEEYGTRGFTVVGFPCNQFNGQEPGTEDEIADFCSTNYGTTFPLTSKVDVNGRNAHPVWATLTRAPDAEGQAGEVQWNFEKFLVAKDGSVVARFRPRTDPADPEVTSAIAATLAQ